MSLALVQMPYQEQVDCQDTVMVNLASVDLTSAEDSTELLCR